MAIKLNISVADINATLTAGYTYIKIYRSADISSGFAEITTPANIISLVSGVSSYTFTDPVGTTLHWYRFTYSSNLTESSFSSSFQGLFVDLDYEVQSYPDEVILSSEQRHALDRIRIAIGDPKELTRDYVSATTGYDSISVDGYTHTFTNPKGWPLKIILDGIEISNQTVARVNDYQFLTLSGVQVNTVSGTLDVWYNHFRYGDAEILRAYNSYVPPPRISPADVTVEICIICTAADLVAQELRGYASTSATEIEIFQEIRVNPKGALDARFKDLDFLRKECAALLDDLEDELYSADIVGVLID